MSDAVNKPAHYNQGPIECIDAMQQILTPEEFRGFLKGNAFKYLWREKGKNGIEDLRKGKDYYDRLIQSFDESEPEQPKPTLNSDKIPDGYRKLNDSSIEPRQRGDLRWSVAERRYIEIGFDEIGYANRDNWAACRRIEPVIKQSLNTEPPDGWRWLELGEVIRKGDKPKNGDSVPLLWIGTPCCNNQFILRRNKFEVGEKVVHGDLKSTSISTVKSVLSDGWVDLVRDGVLTAYHVKDLAPYIEETT